MGNTEMQNNSGKAFSMAAGLFEEMIGDYAKIEYYDSSIVVEGGSGKCFIFCSDESPDWDYDINFWHNTSLPIPPDEGGSPVAFFPNAVIPNDASVVSSWALIYGQNSGKKLLDCVALSTIGVSSYEECQKKRLNAFSEIHNETPLIENEQSVVPDYFFDTPIELSNEDLLILDPIFAIIKDAIIATVGDRKIYMYQIELETSEILNQNVLLPVIIVSAAIYWTPIVSQLRGKGGFHISLVPDSKSLSGYRVNDIISSSPLFITIPIIDLIKRLISKDGDDGEVIVLDRALLCFERFMAGNGFNVSELSKMSLLTI